MRCPAAHKQGILGSFARCGYLGVGQGTQLEA